MSTPKVANIVLSRYTQCHVTLSGKIAIVCGRFHVFAAKEEEEETKERKKDGKKERERRGGNGLLDN